MCSEMERRRSIGSLTPTGSGQSTWTRRLPSTWTGTPALMVKRLGALGPFVQPAAQRAGDDREHDVVDRAAEGVAHRAEVVEAGVQHRQAPVRPTRTFSGVSGGVATCARPLRRGPSARLARTSHAAGAERVVDRRGRELRRGGGGARLPVLSCAVASASPVCRRTAWRGCRRACRPRRARARPWTASAHPPPSRCSTIHSSHSGFDGSRRWENTRAASASKMPWSPGAGSPVWRTW